MCFSAHEAGQVASSLIESLAAMKRLQQQLDEERLKHKRLGWSVGCGGGLGYDLSTQSSNIEPFCGAIWGVRF